MTLQTTSLLFLQKISGFGLKGFLFTVVFHLFQLKGTLYYSEIYSWCGCVSQTHRQNRCCGQTLKKITHAM